MQYFNSIDKGVYEMQLFGNIGYEIDGNRVAQELSYIDGEQDIKEVILRINSGGGNILNGMNIVSAITTCKTKVTTINEGVAASMASVIFLVGKERKMRDYAQLMIHNPIYAGTTLKDMPEGKEKRTVTALRDMLAGIIKSNSTLNKAQVEKYMDEETWFSAKECKRYEMADKVIQSKRELKLPTNSLELAMNMATNIINNNKMTDLINHFDLPVDASQADIMEKVKGLENSLKETRTKFADEKSNNEKLSNELKDVNASLEAKNVEAEALREKLNESKAKSAQDSVENAIEKGLLKEEDKEEMVELAKNNFEVFEKLISKVSAKPASISNEIKGAKKGSTDNKANWTYADWQANDPQGLLAMQTENSELFNKLLDEYTK